MKTLRSRYAVALLAATTALPMSADTTKPKPPDVKNAPLTLTPVPKTRQKILADDLTATPVLTVKVEGTTSDACTQAVTFELKPDVAELKASKVDGIMLVSKLFDVVRNHWQPIIAKHASSSFTDPKEIHAIGDQVGADMKNILAEAREATGGVDFIPVTAAINAPVCKKPPEGTMP